VHHDDLLEQLGVPEDASKEERLVAVVSAYLSEFLDFEARADDVRALRRRELHDIVRDAVKRHLLRPGHGAERVAFAHLAEDLAVRVATDFPAEVGHGVEHRGRKYPCCGSLRPPFLGATESPTAPPLRHRGAVPNRRQCFCVASREGGETVIARLLVLLSATALVVAVTALNFTPESWLPS